LNAVGLTGVDDRTVERRAGAPARW